MTRTRNWTAGMALVALCAFLVGFGAWWLLADRWPLGTAQATFWGCLTASCVHVSTVKLRAELEACRARLAAWNGSESRDDLAAVGPISPPGGVRMVGSGDITTAGTLHVREGATGWLGPDDISWDRAADGFNATLTTECGATVRINTDNLATPPRRLEYGWCRVHDDTRDCRLMKLEHDRPRPPVELYDQDAEHPLPEVDHDRMRRALDSLPDEGWVDLTDSVVGEIAITPGHVSPPPGSGWLTPDEAAERVDLTWSPSPEVQHRAQAGAEAHVALHLGQPCADCGKPATSWISDPGEDVEVDGEMITADLTFLCDACYAAAMAAEHDLARRLEPDT